MAVAPKAEHDADVVLPIDLENAHGRDFRSACLEAARSACPQLAAICARTMGTMRHEVLAVMRQRMDC